MENSTLIGILKMTAWRMETPQLFGGFHIAVSILSAGLAIAAAVIFARRIRNERSIVRVLAVTGWLLVFLEVYKQLFLYFIVNDGAFDWWFFPFQLCSVPMYLCIVLPLMKNPLRPAVMTFIGGYTFISAAATLIYPEDILRPYVALTAHGFIWHGLLLFISLFIILTGSVDADTRGMLRAFALFAILCMIALGINIYAESVMPAIHAAHPAVAHTWAAMFYLNPYHISPQPVVSTVQEAIGIPAGLVLYVLAIAAAGSLSAHIFPRFFRVDDRLRK